MDRVTRKAHSFLLMAHTTWEHFEHEADMGLRVAAPTREAMFEGIAEALTAVITEPDRVRASQSVRVACEAPDDALLMVDWLNALVYEMATRRMLFREFHVTLEGRRLTATVLGEPIDRERHQPAVEVKGATYTALSVEHGDDGLWHGQCVVDV
ncbi:MAG: archease [Gammaproteobacteria bacterium]|nr:archease [Gammaproteobacteria bacterium]MDH4255529.1 archease [Gammaproteobacteria bacterium]MDH5311295.1 archease [Gammaproteobacteria bacterium]